MSENSPAAVDVSSTSNPPAKRAVPVFGLIALVLVAAVGGWAAYIYATGKDGFSWKRFTFQNDEPQFLQVKGVVLLNGEPLKNSNGSVRLFPVDEEGNADRSRHLTHGRIEDDGRFTLYTDRDGLKEGAAAGRYKVTILAFYPGAMGGIPPRMLPDQFYDKSSTPLEVVIEKSSATDDLVIKMEGELRPAPKRRKQPPSSSRGPGRGPGGPGGPRGRPPGGPRPSAGKTSAKTE